MKKTSTPLAAFLRAAYVSIVFGALFPTLVIGQITYDGVMSTGEWPVALATSGGGPGPGFGAGHEINAVYFLNADPDTLHFAIAGNVQNTNRILMFIDSKTGGVPGGGFGRSGAPAGINNFNSGTTFDTGFLPDYCLVIGTNSGSTNYFFDLYELLGSPASGTNNFLGDASASFIGTSPLNGNTTRGFEIGIVKSALGYLAGTDIRIFLAYISDGGFLSNQFLTIAGPSDGNYTGGPVAFGSAAPNPILISAGLLPATLESFDAFTVRNGVQLSWVTSHEQNLDFFAIERSADQAGWAEIGQVAALNGANKRTDYSFEDTDASGTSFYRLRMTDLDGSFTYSAVVEAGAFHLNARVRYENGSLFVSGLHPQMGGRVSFADLRGAVIADQQVNGPQGEIALPELALGIYLVRIATAEGEMASRIVVK